MNQMNQKEFLKRFCISAEDFQKTGYEWKQLEKIYDHFKDYRQTLIHTVHQITERIAEFPKVHSVKSRIKEAEHLLGKIIRKKLENGDFKVDLNDYQKKITDIVGIRALHLYKEDWLEIHKKIMATWDPKETPVANIRKGDDSSDYLSNACQVKENPNGYRSIHYLIITKPEKIETLVEIQVRTLFEEGWSEIDHKMIYPYDQKNEMLGPFLRIFNASAHNADEMATYIKRLKEFIESIIKKHEEDIKEFKDQINKLKLDVKEKENLIAGFNKVSFPTSIFPSANFGMDLQNWAAVGPSSKDSLSSIGVGTCRNCNKSYFKNMFDLVGDKGLCESCKRKLPNGGALK